MILVGLATMLNQGCTRTLPRYQWHDAASAISTMQQRDSGIQTISATFSLLLQSGEGQVELRGAIVAQPPNQLRLRAWKVTRTVLDMTLNSDGLFVFSAARGKKNTSASTTITHDRLMEAVAFLPGFGDITSWKSGVAANQNFFTLSQSISPDNAHMTCSIDKSTLTTSACTYLDEKGLARQTLTFDGYKSFNNIAWPMRLSGKGDSGNFEIHFARVTINEELSPRAFVPSRRAKKKS